MDKQEVAIRANKIEYVPIDQLIPYEKNMNQHSAEQIERLCQLIEYQGFRDPLIVQMGTNIIAAGHGRWEAAKKLGMETVPVTYQEFENEAQFYAFVVSHNAIAKDSWASLDLGQINTDILDLGPDLNVTMLGLKDFEVEPLDADLPDLGDGSDPDIQQVTFTLSNEQKDFLDQAMDKAKRELDCSDEINKNKNGNIMGALARHYVNS